MCSPSGPRAGWQLSPACLYAQFSAPPQREPAFGHGGVRKPSPHASVQGSPKPARDWLRALLKMWKLNCPLCPPQLLLGPLPEKVPPAQSSVPSTVAMQVDGSSLRVPAWKVGHLTWVSELTGPGGVHSRACFCPGSREGAHPLAAAGSLIRGRLGFSLSGPGEPWAHASQDVFCRIHPPHLR